MVGPSRIRKLRRSIATTVVTQYAHAMSVDKLSISLDSELAASVRDAANEQGVSVSTWFADAAQAQVRRRNLREALDAVAAEDGPLSAKEIDSLIAAARQTSQIVLGAEGAA